MRFNFHFAREGISPLTGLSNSEPDRVFSSRDRRLHRLGWSWGRCPFLWNSNGVHLWDVKANTGSLTWATTNLIN